MNPTNKDYRIKKKNWGEYSSTKLNAIFCYLFTFLFCKFDLDTAKYIQQFTSEYPPELQRVPDVIESPAWLA